MTKRTSYISALLLLPVITFLIGYYDLFSYDRIIYGKTKPGYATTDTIGTGDELVFIYVGSSSCGWSIQENNINTVRELKRVVSKKAISDSLMFSTVGISIDWNPLEGYMHLRRLGYFDEVIVGSSWKNTGANRYVWNLGLDPSTPQVAVVRRSLVVKQRSIQIKSRRILTHRSGVDNIEKWLNNGAPINI